MNIITTLEGYNLPKVNKLLNKLFGSNNLDVRMKCCDNIIDELENNNIEVDSDMEDEIKDLAIG